MRARVGPLVVVAVGVVAAQLIVAQLGWVRVGTTTRNSYEAFRSAQRLGVDRLTPWRVVWYLLPVASLTIGLALAWGRRRLAGGILGLQSAVVAGAGVVVVQAEAATAPGAVLALPVAVAGLVVAGGLVRSG